MQVDNEEKKRYLLSYQQSKRAVKRLEQELQEVEEMGEVEEIQEKIKRERQQQIKRYERVRQQVEAMEEEREKDALIYKYICGMTEDAAAKKMGYTKRQFQRINKKALEHFEVCR